MRVARAADIEAVGAAAETVRPPLADDQLAELGAAAVGDLDEAGMAALLARVLDIEPVVGVGLARLRLDEEDGW